MMASMSQNFSSVKSIIGHLINNLEWTSTQVKKYIDLQTTKELGNTNSLMIAIENNDMMIV